jgi:hypothetical protein
VDLRGKTGPAMLFTSGGLYARRISRQHGIVQNSAWAARRE